MTDIPASMDHGLKAVDTAVTAGQLANEHDLRAFVAGACMRASLMAAFPAKTPAEALFLQSNFLTTLSDVLGNAGRTMRLSAAPPATTTPQ